MPYRLLRPLLFSMPPEAAHAAAGRILGAALGTPAGRAAARRALAVDHPALASQRWGIRFPNPVGLAAGWDKAGTHFNALGALGFGFVEIGTITALAQPGNPRPRLFRLPADRALLNRMGFNNPGADCVAAHLASTQIEPVLGINLGKSKATPEQGASEDYVRSAELLQRFAHYLVVNVSSPNTPGLRGLQEAGPLRTLLRALQRVTSRPVLVKIAPDLTGTQVDTLVDLARNEGAAGLIVANTTVSRAGLRTPPQRIETMGAGGISGAPLQQRALRMIARVFLRTRGALPVIGVGGIFNADDAWAMIRNGASLIQIWTGLIYEGPLVVRRINRGLLLRLQRGGFSDLDDAIGSGLD